MKHFTYCIKRRVTKQKDVDNTMTLAIVNFECSEIEYQLVIYHFPKHPIYRSRNLFLIVYVNPLAQRAGWAWESAEQQVHKASKTAQACLTLVQPSSICSSSLSWIETRNLALQVAFHHPLVITDLERTMEVVVKVWSCRNLNKQMN